MRHGFLLINKPAGPTSHDIVYDVRRALSERKVGHLGTLDPQAEGLLVTAVGSKALKIVELYSGASKEYLVEITLGKESTTYDREGVISDVTMKAGWEVPEDGEVRIALEKRFMGKTMQLPPIYSAIKIGGERAYRKVRQGKNVEMPEREVEFHSCDVEFYDYPILRVRVGCSAGTYMRTFAHDVGQLLRCGGYMSALTRMKVGDFNIEDACGVDDIAWTRVIPLKEILKHRKGVNLTQEQWDDIRHGRTIDGVLPKDTIGWFDDLPCVILEPIDGKKMKARKVL